MTTTLDFELGDTRLILAACRRHGLPLNQAAYVLATAYWETARTLKPVQEAFWMSEDWRKRNLRYHPWHGRGYVQLTWEKNYRRAGDELGIDLISDPVRALDPEIAAEVLVRGMRAGWFTGVRLDDYLTPRASNYRGARRIVNGTDKAAAIAEIAREYENALSTEGYDTRTPPPVIEDQRDGTPPRTSPTQSRTLQAQIVQWVGAGGAVGAAWFGAQTEGLQIAIVVSGAVIAVAGLVIFRERLRHWAEGVR